MAGIFGRYNPNTNVPLSVRMVNTQTRQFAPVGTISSYQPSIAERAGYALSDLAEKFGASRNTRQYISDKTRDVVSLVPGFAIGEYAGRKAFNAQKGGPSGAEATLDVFGVAPFGKVAGMFGKAALAKAPALAMFLGATAKNADLAALKAAERMASQGADRRAIWDATGWFRGADDKWRFEIDDRFANVDVKGFPEPPHMGSLTNKASRELYGKSFMELAPNSPERMKAQDIARMQANEAYSVTIPSSEIVYHPELMRAYEGFPSFGRNREPGFGGYYDDINNQIRISDPELGRAGNPTSTGLHELQHFVQGKEGFALGGNPTFGHKASDVPSYAKMAYENNLATADEDAILMRELGADVPQWMLDKKPWSELTKREKLFWNDAGRNLMYRRLAGEVEARNVQARMGMTMPERMATPPWETQDVPFEQQIMRFNK